MTAHNAPLYGIPIVMFVLVNGIILGTVLSDALSSGVSTVILVGGILPHGVFEFTAVAFALGIGFIQTGKFVRGKKRRKLVPDSYYVKLFCATVIPLLLFASAIETWLTPITMQKALEMLI